MSPDLGLEQFREYLALLGRLQLDDALRAKVDVSGVVQMTMLEAHQQAEVWNSLDEDCRKTWLRKIFANNLLDEIRRFRTLRRDADRERSLAALEQSASRLELWIAAEQTSPSQKAVREEESVRLANALARLPDAQREAIELHHLQGMKLEEVGQRMCRTKGAAATLIYRGTSRLRELLEVGD